MKTRAEKNQAHAVLTRKVGTGDRIAIESALLKTPVYLEKRDPARWQCRFYRIRVRRTLFGPWTMIREWGRIGSPSAVRESWYDSEQEALAAGKKLLERKTRRGYQSMGH